MGKYRPKQIAVASRAGLATCADDSLVSCPEAFGVETANRGQLRPGRRRCFREILSDLQLPPRLAANLVDGMSRVNRCEVGLPAARRKTQDTKGRDDRHRAITE